MKKLISGLMVLSAMLINTPAVCAQADAVATPQPGMTAQGMQLDLNAATAEELQRLPGIGISKAKAIVEYRERVGGFLEVEQLTEVKGIGSKMLAKIRNQVAVK